MQVKTTPIIRSAKDRNANWRRAAALLLAVVCGLCPLSAAAARLALLIGIDDYKHVPRLHNAVADARAVAAMLERNGFTVSLVLNASEREIKAALRSFKVKVEGGDDVVVFFAGHGVQIGNANYLLPVDVRAESDDQVRDEAIALQRVLDDLDERRARFTLAIVDACRDNPFRRTGRSIGGRGLAPTSPATGQMVMYSAGSGQRALDRLSEADKEPNGLFTRVLLKEMEKPGLAADRMIRNVRAEVARLARDVRHEQVPAIYDQALGVFYFKPPPPKTAARVAAAPTSVPSAAAATATAPASYPSYSHEDKDFGIAATTHPKRKPYGGPTPTSIPGGKVVKAAELVDLLKANPDVVVIDVNNSTSRVTVPGAWWMANGGEAGFTMADRSRFEAALTRVTSARKSRPIVFLCASSSCWLSYNAALLAIELGYTKVIWFRGGTAAWMGANQDLKKPRVLE